MVDTFDASLRDLRREKAGLEADLKAGIGERSSTRHETHFEPSLLKLNGIL